MSGKWKSSWATEHTKECHGQFGWLHPKTVRISLYMYERKIREALELNKLRTINEKDKTFTVLDRENGDSVTTNFWKPLFMKMGNHETLPYDANIMTSTFVTFQFENGFL